jgi:hypothetical protein
VEGSSEFCWKMCHFITAVLPGSANFYLVGDVAARFDRAWRPLASNPVLGQLRDGETYYLTTPGHCDCETVLGQATRAVTAAGRVQKLARLRKKGWSETKIDRWLADKEHADKRRHQRVTAGTLDADRWLALLREILSSGATETIGLLMHWYSGPISDADFIFARERVPLLEVTPDFLLNIEEDRLYEFSI